MKINELMMMIVSAIIGIVVVVAVMVPIIDSSSESVKSIGNNTTAYYVSDTKITEDLVFTCDPTTDSFFVNGVEIDWKTVDAGSFYRQIFVFTNVVSISFGSQHDGFTFTSLDYPNVGTGGAVRSLTINDDGTWSAISINGNTTYEGITPVEWAIYPSTTGTLGCYALDFNVTEGKDALVLNGTRNITVDGTAGFLYSRTTITDGVATTDYAKTIVGGEITDISLDVVAPGEMEDGYYHYDGGYTISSDSFAPLATGGVIFAPIEYEYVSESDGVVRTLLNVLPIFTVVGLIIGVLSMIRIGRT